MWKIIILVILLLVIIRLLDPRTYCPCCKKRTGCSREDEVDEGRIVVFVYCTKCLKMKGLET